MKKKKKFKHFVTNFSMYFFSKALLCCNKYDNDFKKYVSALPEKFVLRFRVLPYGAQLVIVKKGEKLEVNNTKGSLVKADTDICFKNIEGAYDFFLGRKSLAKCFVHSAIVLYGNVSNMMTFSHMFDIVASYFMPKWFLRKNERPILSREGGVHKIRFITIFGRKF